MRGKFRKWAVLLAAFGPAIFGHAATEELVDVSPPLRLDVRAGGAGLNWFGENGARYQAQSSPNLVAWTNLGGVSIGTGAVLSLPLPAGAPQRNYFRVTRLETISAGFAAASGTVTVRGDVFDNAITIGRDVAGALRINGGVVPIAGGAPTVANTTTILVLGGPGADQISLDETNGALPGAQVFGEAGDDILTGGAGADLLDGGPGCDTLRGRQGQDILRGGADDDIVQWNPGDGSDVVEGQGGSDRLIFNGSNAAESIDVSANGSRVRLFRDVANVVMDLNQIERIDVSLLGGADSVVVNEVTGTGLAHVQISLSDSGGTGDGQVDTVTVNGTALADSFTISGGSLGVTVAGPPTTVGVSGGEGTNDRLVVNGLSEADVLNAGGLAPGAIGLVLNGGLGNDTLTGGAGDDSINGGDGNDLIRLGAGNDTMVWNPGDDNDSVEGGPGIDTLVFNGSNVGEIIELSANGAGLRLFRNVANVLIDCEELEQVQINALGGADGLVVNPLAGTGVASVTLNLAASNGLGDGQPDTITLNGTPGDDTLVLSAAGGSIIAAGIASHFTFIGAEPTQDRLVINLLAGQDVLEASDLPANFTSLTCDGGDDDDTLIGSGGNDVLLGGAGDDVLLGGPGTDILDGGPGDNIVIQ